jgi:cytochrome c-type biogenesis protein CcmH/NrfG
MPPRFCPQCGTRAVAAAKFCSDCGARLDGSAPASSGRWQLTSAGSGVLGFFLVAGLAMWVVILSPTPPRPAPGGGAPHGPQADASEVPEGHPKVPLALPQEAKGFMAELAAKAKEKPNDAATWVRLGQVYYRAAEFDPAYYGDALSAFQHVLELEPQNADALRGTASIHFDRDEHKEAAGFFERFLATRPDDLNARTLLGASYSQMGETEKGIAALREVVKTEPTYWPAHYYLGAIFGQQGDDQTALVELRKARDLATDDRVRKRIDDMIASVSGEAPAGPATAGGSEKPATPLSPFQSTVEKGLRDHPILGPRIIRVEWTGAGDGRVVVQNFPMAGMPPAVRDKFTGRLADQLRQAQAANPVTGTVRLQIADASSGDVMATVTP